MKKRYQRYWMMLMLLGGHVSAVHAQVYNFSYVHTQNVAVSLACSQMGQLVGMNVGMALGALVGGSLSFGTLTVPAATVGAVVGSAAGAYLFNEYASGAVNEYINTFKY